MLEWAAGRFTPAGLVGFEKHMRSAVLELLGPDRKRPDFVPVVRASGQHRPCRLELKPRIHAHFAHAGQASTRIAELRPSIVDTLRNQTRFARMQPGEKHVKVMAPL